MALHLKRKSFSSSLSVDVLYRQRVKNNKPRMLNLTITHITLTKYNLLKALHPFRLASSKSGKIYLHTDVRMIIFRKSDLDTAADHESGMGFELRLDLNKTTKRLFLFFSGLSLVVQKILNFHPENKGSNWFHLFGIIHGLLYKFT